MGRLFRKEGDVPKKSLWQRIKDIALTDVAVIARGGVSQGSLEQLEELLLAADFGVRVTIRLVAQVETLAQRGKIKSQDEFLGALRDGISRALATGNADATLRTSAGRPTV